MSDSEDKIGPCCVEDAPDAVVLVKLGAPIVYVYPKCARQNEKCMAVFRDGDGDVSAGIWDPQRFGDEVLPEMMLATKPKQKKEPAT